MKKLLLLLVMLVLMLPGDAAPTDCPVTEGTGMSLADRIKQAPIVVQVEVRH